MTQEEINQLSMSFYRQMYFVKMLKMEQHYFLKQSKNGGVKQVLKRLSDSNDKGIEQLLSYMPNSRDTVIRVMKESEEKIQAMVNIIEKISLLDEATVLQLEDDFNKHVTIKY